MRHLYRLPWSTRGTNRLPCQSAWACEDTFVLWAAQGALSFRKSIPDTRVGLFLNPLGKSTGPEGSLPTLPRQLKLCKVQWIYSLLNCCGVLQLYQCHRSHHTMVCRVNSIWIPHHLPIFSSHRFRASNPNTNPYGHRTLDTRECNGFVVFCSGCSHPASYIILRWFESPGVAHFGGLMGLFSISWQHVETKVQIVCSTPPTVVFKSSVNRSSVRLDLTPDVQLDPTHFQVISNSYPNHFQIISNLFPIHFQFISK
jgi:hypothetical protein